MTIIPVLFALESRELQFILENSDAEAIVTSPEVYPKVAAAVRALGRSVHVVVTGDRCAAPAGCLSFATLVAKSPLSEIVAREGGDLATVLYTSGTTGRPKGVMQTHHNLYANAMNGWNSATRREKGETSLLALPLAHSFGLSALISGYLFGGKAVLMRWFNPEGALELIQKHRVKAMAGVP